MPPALVYRFELAGATAALVLLVLAFHPGPAPLFKYPTTVHGPTFAVVSTATLPPEGSAEPFEVRSRVTVTGMGEKDDGYEGGIWVVGGSAATAGSCGSLYATFGPHAGKGATTCPCHFGFGVQCGTADQAPLKSPKEHSHDFGTTLKVSMQYDHGRGIARIVVNGEVEVEDKRKWAFARQGALTLLAGDHDSASGKTEDLKGSLSDFAVFQPPSDPTSWGWSFVALLAASALLYGAAGSALMISRGKKAGGGGGAGSAENQHIHQAQWRQLWGLVVDGVRFTRARVQGRAARGSSPHAYAALGDARDVGSSVGERGRPHSPTGAGGEGGAGDKDNKKQRRHTSKSSKTGDGGATRGSGVDAVAAQQRAPALAPAADAGPDAAAAGSSSQSRPAGDGGRWVHVAE